MTVKELIEVLNKLPPEAQDAKVFYADNEYNGSTSPVNIVYYHDKASRAAYANTVVLQ